MRTIDNRFIREALVEAYTTATKSPDPSSQCGASVFGANLGFIASECNTFTAGVDSSPEKLERPLKYSYVEHAERNAIYAAARIGIPPEIMVAPWAACTECARAIVQSGISILIRHKQASDRSPERWLESIKFADDLLLAGGVEIIEFDGHLAAPAIMHCEELWTP